jgi:hypothetical protein
MTQAVYGVENLATKEQAQKILQDLVHYRTYASTLETGRKETRTEVIDRVKNMHLTKFP